MASDRDKIRVNTLGSIPYLVLVAITPHPTVTHVILNWRLHHLGGERYCRARLRELATDGLLELHDGGGNDRREKQVRLTHYGQSELVRLRELLDRIGGAN